MGLWWIKLEVSFQTDPVLRGLIMEHGSDPAWVLVTMKLLAAEGGDSTADGRLYTKNGAPMPASMIADRAALPLSVTVTSLDRLSDAGVTSQCSDGAFCIVDYEPRPLTESGKRMKRKRAKDKEKADAANLRHSDVTPSVTVTSPIELELEREKELEIVQGATSEAARPVDFSDQELNLLGTEPVHAVPTAPDPKPQGCKRAQSFYDSLANDWNSCTDGKTGSVPKARTPVRVSTARNIDKALTKEPDLDYWRDVFGAVAASPHHRGKDGGFRASFPWVWESSTRVREPKDFSSLIDARQSQPQQQGPRNVVRAGMEML